jgi:hypothetical protein
MGASLIVLWHDTLVLYISTVLTDQSTIVSVIRTTCSNINNCAFPPRGYLFVSYDACSEQ